MKLFLDKLIPNGTRKSIVSLLLGLILTYIVFSIVAGDWTILFFGIQNGFSKVGSISQVVSIFTFILLVSLAFSVASKTGLIDISIPGKILLSSILSFIVAFKLHTTNSALILIACILVSFVTSLFISIIMIWLKNRFNVNEVIFGILVNLIVAFIYIALTRGSRFAWIAEYGDLYSFGYLLNFNSYELEYMTWFVFIAIALAVLTYIFYKWTPIGFRMTVLGKSKTVGKTIGINTQRIYLVSTFLTSLFISLGTIVYIFAMQQGTLDATMNATPSDAFSAMAVSSLSYANPIGIVFNSLIFASTSFSKDYIEQVSDLNSNVINIITGVLMVVISITPYIISKYKSIFDNFRNTLFRINTRSIIKVKGGK